jgi:uncharacterized protein
MRGTKNISWGFVEMYLTKYLVKHPLDKKYVVLVNTLSGALDIITSDELNDIELINEGIKLENQKLLNMLIKRGYIYDSEGEEEETFEMLRRMILRLEEEEQTVITICPTYSCNFRCTYCYEGELTSTFAKPLTNSSVILLSIVEIENYLKEHRALKKKPDLAFIGGEPLLGSTKKDVIEVFNACAVEGYKFRIITNGFFLDLFLKDFATHLKSIKYIQITLDGPRLVHDRRRPLANSKGTFNKITENIQGALDIGIPIRLRTNVDSNNVAFLPELADYIKNRRWAKYPNFKAYLAPVEDSTCIGIENIMREDAMLEAWLGLKANNKLYEGLTVFDDSKLFGVTDALEAALTRRKRKVLPRFKYCAATKGKLFVLGADGYIYLCLRGVGDLRASVGKFHPNFEIYDEKINLWLSRDIGNINCSSCSEVSTLQGGGCAIEALRRTGNLHACSCGEAPIIINNFLEMKKQDILMKFTNKDASDIPQKDL